VLDTDTIRGRRDGEDCQSDRRTFFILSNKSSEVITNLPKLFCAATVDRNHGQ
jgi:hypothetical protein